MPGRLVRDESPPSGVRAVSAESTLAGWGRLPVPGREVVGEDLGRLTEGAVLTRGLGRSYGDSALPPPGHREVAGSRLADRILAFDAETGLLRAEAGLSLEDVIATFLPRGFWPPVVPGTKFVTLGGMVAADVHGKNHHVGGTFGQHVTALTMRLADGRIVECSRDLHPDLFRATLGGMGLTGHILEVECRLSRAPSPWIWQESRADPRSRSVHCRAPCLGSRLAFHGRLDRLSGTGAGDGTGLASARPLGRAERGPPTGTRRRLAPRSSRTSSRAGLCRDRPRACSTRSTTASSSLA